MDDLLKKMFYVDDFEIVIKNNGSAEQTKKVLEKYRQNFNIRIIESKKHKGLNAYKELFNKAKGDYIIDVDDDVLEFPLHFDKAMVEYMKEYTDYGFLALNVLQNEYTNGAKPSDSSYVEDARGGNVVQKGPAGGWCACFRKRDYRKIQIFFNVASLSFKNGEDAMLASLFRKVLKLKSGIIKSQVCFHATGAYYAKKYGHLEREIEKYSSNQLDSLAEHYKSFLDN